MSICIEVTYSDHQIGHYPVPAGEGWRVDSALRLLVIGRGVPRKMIPLDVVQMFEVVATEARDQIQETDA